MMRDNYPGGVILGAGRSQPASSQPHFFLDNASRWRKSSTCDYNFRLIVAQDLSSTHAKY